MRRPHIVCYSLGRAFMSITTCCMSHIRSAEIEKAYLLFSEFRETLAPEPQRASCMP